MPSKRRNNGRAKKNKGHADTVRCLNCARFVGKDKSIKRFAMRNIVDGSSKRDIKDNYAYDDSNFQLPKIYVKQFYCVSCAIHARIVKARSVKRGTRSLRYTTKLRQNVRDEARTNGFAIPAPTGYGK